MLLLIIPPDNTILKPFIILFVIKLYAEINLIKDNTEKHGQETTKITALFRGLHFKMISVSLKNSTLRPRSRSHHYKYLLPIRALETKCTVTQSWGYQSKCVAKYWY